MVRTLLKSEDGKASKEAIARQFLGIDESQLNYYKAITGRWPHRTLKGHGIVRYDRKGEVYTLLLDDATAEQKKRLMELRSQAARVHRQGSGDTEVPGT